MQFELKRFETGIFRYGLGLCAFAMLTAIGVYAYLGTFSRYLSDDYCEAVATRESIIGGVVDRYMAGDWRAANRYSNLLFVGLGELLGENNIPIVTAAMVILWPLGLSWSVHEFRKFFKQEWSVSMDCFLGSTLGFFILLQAPNLFQTIYWRSSMMTHFAPLVLGSFVFAFWMRQAARTLNEKISLPIYLIIFFTTFMIAGFSEPPVATVITALGLLIAAVLYFANPLLRQKLLTLLAWTFAGALLGLLVMIFSPAAGNMAGNSTPSIFELLRDSFLFGFYFIEFSLKELPLPSFLSMLIPALLVWSFQGFNPSELSLQKKRIIWTVIIVSPVVMWILIAAGFSPSVYGQGYPVERMRFLARAIMTATLMLEGGLIGLLTQKVLFGSNRSVNQWSVVFLIALLGFVYPLRAALNIYRSTVPEYRARAEMWDLRNDYIVRHASLGESDIVIPTYDGVYQIKELDDDPSHWANVCASRFYGVNTIRAVSIPDEYILGYLSE